MKHIAFFKLAPGADIVAFREKLWKTHRKLDDELEWLNHTVIIPRCEDTESSYDIMLSVEIEGPARLRDYLDHPLVRKLEEKIAPLIEGRATFDHY